ncbi:MAG TPA: ribonuclease T2 [Solimonas sp.]|nr:ribonuclease T2 [Solimonas sp.]
MKHLLGAACLGLLLAATSAGARDKAGEFDYWLLSLSWSPQFCVHQTSEMQCVTPYDFVVHGLWPQHEKGYPDYCGGQRELSQNLVRRLMPLMPSEKLIQHQWRKHGSCSGLSPEDYVLTVERARRAIVVPPTYREPTEYRRTDLDSLQAEFARFNPKLTPETLAVQCSGRWLKEVRVCMDRDFAPRACGEDVADRCGAEIMIRPNRPPRNAP